MVRGFSIALIIPFCIAVAPLSWSADSGSIRVQVCDDNANRIKDAQVTLTRKGDGATVGKVQTDDDGMAILADLDPAQEYEITVEKPEHKTMVIRQVRVYAKKATSVAVTLHPSVPPRRHGPVRLSGRQYVNGAFSARQPADLPACQ